jgi:hypothetical protein
MDPAPPGRVKKRRAVVIDDSDDDPTPVRRKRTPIGTSSRFAADGRDFGTVDVGKRETLSGDAPEKKPPQWASRIVRSEPFAYAAAVKKMRAAGSAAGRPGEANVTLHGWFLNVRDPRSAAEGGFEIPAGVHDGTGALEAVVPSAMTLKILDIASAASFDALDPGERKRLQTWTAGYLRGFLGKVTLRVSTRDDGTPATVLKVFGPRDFHDKTTTEKLGKRCEGIDKTLKLLKREAELRARKEGSEGGRGNENAPETRVKR